MFIKLQKAWYILTGAAGGGGWGRRWRHIFMNMLLKSRRNHWNCRLLILVNIICQIFSEKVLTGRAAGWAGGALTGRPLRWGARIAGAAARHCAKSAGRCVYWCPPKVTGAGAAWTPKGSSSAAITAAATGAGGGGIGRWNHKGSKCIGGAWRGEWWFWGLPRTWAFHSSCWAAIRTCWGVLGGVSGPL